MPVNESPQRGFYLWTALFALACLIPWLAMIGAKAINHDIYWLAIGAREFLHGHRMSTSFYDTNPPLSFIVYVPLYLFSQLTGIALAGAATLTTLAYVMIAAWTLFLLARRFTDGEEAFVLTVSFIVSGTALATAEFGQRDQMLVLAMLPFSAGQLILTRRLKCPKALLWPVFATGAVLILMKPHFGVLPAAFLIHRAVVQRRWQVVFDVDFVMLSAAALAYVALVWLCFRDFSTGILPDMVRLYLSFDDDMIVLVYTAGCAILFGTVWIIYGFIDRDPSPRRDLVRMLLISAFISLIPYLLGMKNYKYHLTPALTFFWTAAGLAIFIVLRRHVSACAAAAAVVAILAATGYIAEPRSIYHTGAEYAALPLTKRIHECGEECGFFLFTTRLPATMMTAYYSGREHATRFPSLWFLPELLQQKKLLDDGKPAGLSRAEYNRLFHKYAGYMAEDMDKRRPGLAIACAQEFDFIKFFKADTGFAQAWKPYVPDGKVAVDYAYYFPDRFHKPFPAMNCDVYRRRG